MLSCVLPNNHEQTAHFWISLSIVGDYTENTSTDITNLLRGWELEEIRSSKFYLFSNPFEPIRSKALHSRFSVVTFQNPPCWLAHARHASRLEMARHKFSPAKLRQNNDPSLGTRNVKKYPFLGSSVGVLFCFQSHYCYYSSRYFLCCKFTTEVN